MRSIDRGGLKYVSDMTYMVFMSMEQEVRKHLQIGKVSQGPQRETIMECKSSSRELPKFTPCCSMALANLSFR